MATVCSGGHRAGKSAVLLNAGKPQRAPADRHCTVTMPAMLPPRHQVSRLQPTAPSSPLVMPHAAAGRLTVGQQCDTAAAAAVPRNAPGSRLWQGCQGLVTQTFVLGVGCLHSAAKEAPTSAVAAFSCCCRA